MSVRFSKMWACMAVWIALDLLMIKFGADLPEWLAFDGYAALKHDSWVIVFIVWMWIAYREPSALPSPHEPSAT